MQFKARFKVQDQNRKARIEAFNALQLELLNNLKKLPMKSHNKIWFITGISSGLGKALAQSVIENGDFVIGTFRNQTQAAIFNNQHKDQAFALSLDITKPNEIQKAFNLISKKIGRVDVLVNNAGYGFAGAIEEISIKETREIFEANFFGTLLLTQTFLPLLRQ